MILHLVAPFLPMKTIANIGNGDLIRQELITRYSWSDEDRRDILLNSCKSFKKHISGIFDVDKLLCDICECHLLDARTKAQLYTYVESGFKRGKYRDL